MTALIMALTMAGCGSDRPSAGDLSSAIQKESKKGSTSALGAAKISKAQADCMGKAIADSDISTKALKALVKGDNNFTASAADKKAATKVLPKMQACAKK
jgi:hypothetical protein